MNHSRDIETVIYGGAFNPPTKAHQAILQACIDYAEPRRADVWMLPSGNRTDKDIGMTKPERLRMLEALCVDVVSRSVNVRIDASELDRLTPTETIDTVLELNERHPERSFTWVFGADSVATMQEWKDGEWLLDNLTMLVVRRPGSIVRTLGRNAALLEVADMPYSSTEVRNRLAHRMPIDDLVSPSVAKILLNST